MKVKDTISIEAFENTEDAFVEKNEMFLNEFEQSNYLATINMEEMTDIYVPVKSHEDKDVKLYLKLNVSNHTQYRDGIKYANIVIPFGVVDSQNVASRMTLERPVAEITENPAGIYELTQELQLFLQGLRFCHWNLWVRSMEIASIFPI